MKMDYVLIMVEIALKKNGDIWLRCKNDEEGYFCLNNVFGCVKKY